MRTFYDIIKDVSNLRWSIVDPDPDSFAEVQKAVKLAIRQAHAYIWGLDDFPFKRKKDAIRFPANVNAVLAPKGTISRVWVEGESEPLTEIAAEDADYLDPQFGKPELYWVEFSDEGQAIKVYPTPDKETIIMVRYATSYMAKSAEGDEKYNLEDLDDTLNIPNDPTVEDAYCHCLYTKSMEYLVADDTDENYKPYQKEFLEAYRNLVNMSGVKREPRLII